ncbi:MAG: nucleotidyltransferase domain-containing protein [bacterium]|nr:nucleotidyltransferase domain-containing protein [bacterium]
MSEKYQEEIKNITKQIIEKYKPEKIILYGSFAYGKPTKDSDVDLFIIKKTRKAKTLRHLEIDRILLDRKMPLDILVYTPEEVRKVSAENLFVKEILNKGKIIYASR